MELSPSVRGLETATRPVDASESSLKDLVQSRESAYTTKHNDVPNGETSSRKLSAMVASKLTASNNSVVSSADATSTKVPNAESQSMTAMSSSSSSTSVLPTSSSNEAAAPSPYGTRSRNRNVNNRPNYAEDHEMDMEYEWTSTKKNQADTTATNASRSVEAELRSANGGRRSLTAGTNGSLSGKMGTPGSGTSSKDYIPGMSTFSVNSDAPAALSKKRKAPGNQSSSSSVTPQRRSSTTSTRRAAMANQSGASSGESNMLTFESSQCFLQNGSLVADDGTQLSVNDHVYLVCEPPGEPYYLARIMEFLHTGNVHKSPIESLRINWVYRPRDIGRKVNDTRQVYGSMHSDTCPLTSLRGKCRVEHRSRIESLEEYRKNKDCFYYSQIYDRYIHRYYDVIPVEDVINVPERVKTVLDAHWKYLIVEIGRGKELTSAVKSCKRCSGYCASNDSVDCAMCKRTYHMNCVRPPLLKKPARGFAWSCGPCSRKQEKKLEARNTPLVGERALEGDDDELLDEDEDDHGHLSNLTGGSSPADPTADNGPRPATAEQLAQARLWPYRYLGIHCKVEDVLDYDDRIYPRASSRLGPRHQANVIVWHGRPLELVKPAEIKKKYVRGSSHKKDAKLSRETIAALDADKLARERRPKWVIDAPPGFVCRGEDHPNSDPENTAKICFRLPEVGERSTRGVDDTSTHKPVSIQHEQIVDEYMENARKLAPSLGLAEYSTNFLDKALELLHSNNYSAGVALNQLRGLDLRKDLKEPRLSKDELKRFEEGVAKYGTNLYEVSRHVGKSQKHGEIVRFYYMWKKTERGKQIWGNFDGRKSKKQAKQLDSTLVDDVADDFDDSAFDNEKAAIRKRGFECKFCSTRHSRQWRRAPGTAPGTTVPAEPNVKGSRDKAARLMVALCQRCAGLWRKYAIQWENIDEVAKKVAQAGGRAWKRKMDEELLIELVNANEASSVGMSTTAVAAAASVGIDVASSLTITPEQEAARKKVKTGHEKEAQQPVVNPIVEPPKKKVIEKPPEPPLIPEQPKLKTLPCAICNEMEPLGDEHFCCRHCRLTVHRNCYGIAEGRSASKWTCDMCSNDSTGQLSTSYECVLCPTQYTEIELMEPPKASHKKKSDREREKERLEKEMVSEATTQYIRKQEELGRPIHPREPLKRTSGNNWVHVVCAVWSPWVKFGNAMYLEPCEGLGSIPASKYQQTCKICKLSTGVCVTCHKCPATFHVTCAHQNGYSIGFDVTPVKSSRRDVINTVSLGSEAGNVEAVIFCKDHAIKSIVHQMNELIESTNMNALQLFVRNFKQADLSLTGTARKAANINSCTRAAVQLTPTTSVHRGSISNGISGGLVGATSAIRSTRASPTAVTVKSEEVDEDGDRILYLSDSKMTEPVRKQCSSCGTESSPKWHRRLKNQPSRAAQVRDDSAPSVEHNSQQQQQQQVQDLNGNNDARGNSRDEIQATHQSSVPGFGTKADGYPSINENGLKDEPLGYKLHTPAAAQMSRDPSLATNGEKIKVDYNCHRCYLKKLREPPAPEAPDQPPSQAQLPHEEVQTIELAASTAHQWPAQLVAPQAHAEAWQTQPGHDYHSSRVIPNGTRPSPPSHIPPVAPTSYPGPPPRYYTNGYDSHEPPRIPPSQHPANGHANGGPSSYHVSRDNARVLEHQPYVSHPPHHGTPQYVRPLSNGTRSPPPPPPAAVAATAPVHYRVPHAPAGPPRAAENPFLMPHHSHSSPRQHYHGPHGSPGVSPRLRGPEERPQTPGDVARRNGGWAAGERETGVANGASASPSLRNLLH